MLDPDYIRNMTRRIRRISQDMEDDVIVIIIGALLLMLEEDAPKETEVAEKIRRVVDKYQIEGNTEIRRIFKDAVKTSMANDAKAIGEAEEIRKAEQTEMEPKEVKPMTVAPVTEMRVPPTEYGERIRGQWGTPRDTFDYRGGQKGLDDPYIREWVNHIHRTTQETWYNLTNTYAYTSTRAYVNAADKAAIAVGTGESSRKAVDDAVDELTDKGIDVVENPETGHKDHVDVAIERNVRTSVAQMAGDLTLENCRQNGITLVLVSAHFGARPTHSVWQGKVYSLTGDTEKYKDFYRETEYGQMLGLCGINCRHSFSPFVEGMHNPYEGTDYSDPERYNLEQMQRAMERRIRKLRRRKRELDEMWKMEKTAELKAERKKVAQQLKEAIQEYEDFCAEHDLRPLWERTRV